MDRTLLTTRTRALIVLAATALLLTGTMSGAFARVDFREDAVAVANVLITLDDERTQDPGLVDDEDSTDALEADNVEDPDDADEPEAAEADDAEEPEVEEPEPQPAPRQSATDDDRDDDADEDRDEADDDDDDEADEDREDEDLDDDRDEDEDDDGSSSRATDTKAAPLMRSLFTPQSIATLGSPPTWAARARASPAATSHDRAPGRGTRAGRTGSRHVRRSGGAAPGSGAARACTSAPARASRGSGRSR